ncbi:MAG: OmpA family protein [Saprospiraceae bacterium]|nr:OmpA family protein [Saprospiraceae bacterium]MBK8080778.1 OmpA family protein [Saprospiraceae bacterium]MBK8819131.1 OmpA family protein [Saprospiraceae bacterium]
MKYLFSFLVLLFLTSVSCVSKKKHNEIQAALDAQRVLLKQCESRNYDLESQLLEANKKLMEVNNKLSVANAELNTANTRASGLSEQIELLKKSNSNLLEQMSSLQVISQTGAESIKRSLEAINDQSSYIKELTKTMQYKDSVSLALVMNLKKSLQDFNDKDVNIEVRQGVVYISLSDNLLFKTASATINPKAEVVLEKIASILNDQKELQVLVEGHTDNVPISSSCIEDNWDLSAKRATSVVRSLQNKYKVAPQRMTAGGRSEFIPKTTNSTGEGRSQNRRTDILILPKLDQFFKLLEAPAGK